jgi:hypothetical protein
MNQQNLSRVAGVASFGMNTDYSAAGWALPFLLFTFQELVHAVALNKLEVLNYAYSIFFFVTFIKRFQCITWKT